MLTSRLKATFILTLLLCCGLNKGIASADGKMQQKPRYGFIENKGQMYDQHNKPNPAVKYLFNGNGLNVQLKQTGFSYDVWKADVKETVNKKKSIVLNTGLHHKEELPEVTYSYHRIDWNFVNPTFEMKIISEQPAKDYLNYYNSVTPVSGATLVHHYAKVVYQNVWNNIDVEFLVNENGFKYNIIVKSGGNVNNVAFEIKGADGLSVNTNGSLLLKNSINSFEETIPYSYVLNNKKQVKTSFLLDGNIVKIKTPVVPNGSTLVIDPLPNLKWGTYYGGGGFESGYSIATDKINNVVSVGNTSSTTAMATAGSYMSTYNGGGDFFIVKFTNAGSLVWGTYYGGSDGENGQQVDIDIDINNNIFIAGSTYSDTVMATTGTYKQYLDGGIDICIAKFNSSGFRMWGTYFGGNGGEQAGGIVVRNKYIYICGATPSTTGVATAGSYQVFNAGNYDAFLAKFDTSGNIIFSTYYGGPQDDFAFGISNGLNKSVFITGTTVSTSSIAIGSVHQPIYGGGINDGFVSKFDSTGNIIWGTYYGGTLSDNLSEVFTDNSGDVYATGGTVSANGIASSGSYQNTLSGADDGIVLKLDSTGHRAWGTYYGGTDHDFLYSIAGNNTNAIYLVGETRSTNNIASINAWQMTLGSPSNEDIVIAKFDTSGVRLWGTYYGGNGGDQSFYHGITLNSNNEILIAALTSSTNDISSLGAYQTTKAAGIDAVIAKFSDACPLNFAIAGSNSHLCVDDNLSLTVSTPGSIYNWNGPNGFNDTTQNPILLNVTINADGIYTVIVDSLNCIDTVSIDVQVDDCSGVIENSNDFSLQVYPNPTSDFLNIVCSEIIDELIFYDCTGRVLNTKICNTPSKFLNIQEYSKGIYFISVIVQGNQNKFRVIKN